MSGRIRQVMTDPELAEALLQQQRQRMADLSGHDFLAKTLAVYEAAR